MPIIKRVLKYRHGYEIETTEADVRALFSDEAQRARLEKDAREVIALLRKLVQHNPREAGYTITADNDTGDLVMSYYLVLTAIWWTQPLYDILKDHPLIKDMEERRLAARSSTGELMTIHAIGDESEASDVS